MFVIAGVSGNTGSIVAGTLLDQGKKVRVIVRDAKKGESWKARGAEVAVASLDDDAAVAKALDGATGAYLLLPPDPASPDYLAARRTTTDALARAVEKSRVPHVVFLSSIGAQHESGTGMIRSAHYAESRLAKTPAKLTFIRASYFLENWAGVLGAAANGKLPTFLPPDLSISMVASKDIGTTAAKALLEPPTAKSEIIELVGPRDYSSRDVAAVLAKIYGKPVEVEAAPLEAVVPAFTSFGMSTNVAALFREMYEGLAKGVVAYDGKDARRLRGNTDADAVLRGLGAGK